MVILCMTEDTVKKGPPIVADLEHVHRFFFFHNCSAINDTQPRLKERITQSLSFVERSHSFSNSRFL